MEEIIDILRGKLSLMGQNRDLKNLSIAEKDKLLDTLLVEKKKESLRVLMETRLQQVIATKHIFHEEEIKELASNSTALMQLYLPQTQSTQPALEGLVKLYRGFFEGVGGSQRVKQIDNLFEKRLCPKSLMPSTLLNWLVEWVRKQFKEFLKTTIHSLYVDSRQPVHFISKENREEEKKESLVEALFIVNKKAIVKQKPRKDNNNNSSSLDVKPLQQVSSLKSLEKYQQERSFLQRCQYQEKGQNEDLTPINKEVFLNAFSEELQNYYKNLENCIQDLEMGWVRRPRKAARREEVLRRAQEVAQSCIKQMPLIKTAIDKYTTFYQNQNTRKSKNNNSTRTEPNEQLAQPKPHPNDTIKITKDQNQHSLSTTERGELDKRQKLLKSLKKSNRYDLQEDQYGSQSNLLPFSRASRREIPVQVNSQTLDLDLSGSQKGRSSKILWLNSGNHSYESQELEIIEEKFKKAKLKVMHGRPLKGSMSRNKSHRKKQKSVNRSVEMRGGSSLEYYSLQVGQGLLREQVRLPRIKKN